MFKLAQSICYPGDPKRPNEDAIGWGRNYFFVLDGASCLSGINVVDPQSDAAWMVQRIKDSLCTLLDNNDSRPTKELLREVLLPIRAEYSRALNAKGIPQPKDSPSAGLALFRQRNGCLEFFGLGDCVGVFTSPNSTPFVSLDTGLVTLDNTALEEIWRLHQRDGIPVPEARLLCNDLLLANRAKRNCPDGYWILDLVSDSGLENAREFSWEITEPIAVGGFSDGFAQLSELFKCYETYHDLFSAMQQTDLEKLYQALYDAQNADADCAKFPRFKLRDDTSAIWGVFDQP